MQNEHREEELVSEESAMQAVAEVLNDAFERFEHEPTMSEEQRAAAVEAIYSVEATLHNMGLLPEPRRGRT